MDNDIKSILKEIKELNKGNKKTEKSKKELDKGPIILGKNVGISIGMGVEHSDLGGGFVSDFRQELKGSVNDKPEYTENKKEQKDIDDLSR